MSRMPKERFKEIRQTIGGIPVDERDTADQAVAELVEEIGALREEIGVRKRADIGRSQVEAVENVSKGWKERALRAEDRLRLLWGSLRAVVDEAEVR